MAKAQTKAKDLRGPSIYQGEKAGTLFYDKFSKVAYVIPNSEAYKYDDYKTYVIIGMILAVAAGLYGGFHFLITLAIIAAIYAVGRIIFQKKCLDYCAYVDYKPEKKEFFLVSWSKDITVKNFIIILVLSVLMFVLCIFNMNKFAEEEFIKTGYLLMAIGTVIFILCVIFSLTYKIKNKNKSQ